MKFRPVYLCSTFLSLFLSDGALTAATGKDIRLQWNGSGCAKSESKTPWDPMVVTLVASVDTKDFQVRRGAGASPKDARKNCDLIVSSTEPVQIALDSIDIKGSGALPTDAKVDLVVEASSQGTPGSKRYALSRKGEEQNFRVRKTLEETDYFWSACGRALQVSAKETIKSGSTVDTRIDGISYNLQIKSCKK